MTICYLCGKEIEGNVSRDHVPPKAIYPTDLRPEIRGQLITLPTHKSCNNSYKDDEDYFVQSWGSTAIDTPVGKALFEDMKRTAKHSQGQRLAEMIYDEFDPMPGGIALPSHLIQKSIDPNKSRRIILKITRGLFSYVTSRILTNDCGFSYQLHDATGKPSDLLKFMAEGKSRGVYPQAFDYTYHDCTEFPEIAHLHLFGMHFWQKLTVVAVVHDSDCTCEVCSKSKLG